MRWPYVIYFVTIIVGLLGGCKGEKIFSTKSDEVKFATSYLKIEELTKQTSIDWEDIGKIIDNLMPFISAVDNEYNANYQNELTESIKNIHNKLDVDVNKQVILKGMQHIAVLKIRDELNQMVKTISIDERKDHFEKIKQLMDIVSVTAKRRDGDGKLGLDDKITRQLADLEKNVGSTDINRLSAIMQLQEIISKIYALSVLYEISEMKGLKPGELDKCKVKRKEAELFYRVIQNDVTRTNKSINEAVIKMIQGPCDNADLGIMKEKLKNGLPLINLD